MDRRTFLHAAVLGSSVARQYEPAASEKLGPARVQPNGQPPAVDGGYYEFSEDGTECIIKRYDTPLPWMNLLNNDTFQTWITHTGHMECLIFDRGLNGLTNPQVESGHVYLCDGSSGRYFMLNRPAPGGIWRARHGLGYSTIEACADALEATITYFVPRDDSVLVWLLSLRNRQAVQRTIHVFSTVEWSLGDQSKTMVFQGHGGGGDAFTGGSQFNLSKRVVLERDALYATQTAWPNLSYKQKPWPYTGFFGAGLPLESFDTTRSIFLGRHGSVEKPAAVERGICSNLPFWGLNEFPWGVLQHQLAIPAGGEQRIALVLGMARNKADIPGILAKYADPCRAEAELEKVKAYWREFLATTTNIRTPAPEIDRNLNVWSKYHWRSAVMRSQNNGLRGLGFWSYGLMGNSIGWAPRELAVQPHDLGIVKECLTTMMQGQYQDVTLGKLSEPVPLMLSSDLDLKWPPPKSKLRPYPHAHDIETGASAFINYLHETGDLRFLEEKTPWVDGGEGTAFDHLARAIEYSLQGLSPRGLALLNPGIGDWDDELNMVSREGRGESVMLSMTICYLLREAAQVAKAADHDAEAAKWLEQYDRIKSAVNRLAWNGEWYIRAFADLYERLTPVGTTTDKEGRIYLVPQSWAVLSGIAEGERAQKCMEAVERYLVCDYGPLNYAPAYTSLNPTVGTCSNYAPGLRNSCIYPRPAGWHIMAECVANRAEEAFDIYWKTSLAHAVRDIDRFQDEPYVYPEVYNGPAHRTYGMGQFQWNLGEGQNWMWHSYVYYILGVRPVLEGLLVDPKIPRAWEGFRVERPFRGSWYEIEIGNPKHVNRGVSSMLVDGRRVNGNLIRAHADGKRHEVKVTLGA